MGQQASSASVVVNHGSGSSMPVWQPMDSVRIWRFALHRWPCKESLDCLSAHEMHRASLFSFDRDRRRYLASHVALRRVLGTEADIPCQSLRFAVGPFGKPLLLPDMGLDFNLSHSEDTAVVAVSTSGPVGVDIEHSSKTVDLAALVQTCFSPTEREQLARMTSESRDHGVLLGWTRKEACLKALGLGLSTPPELVESGISERQAFASLQLPSGRVKLRLASRFDLSGAAISVAQVAAPAG